VAPDLTAIALVKSPELANFSGRVSDSGEGRWTIQAAIDEGTPAAVLTASLFQRFESRGEADFANKLLSAMRFEFGGHVEKKAGEWRRGRPSGRSASTLAARGSRRSCSTRRASP
jgi:6-phosphogluconate dehydrogenase